MDDQIDRYRSLMPTYKAFASRVEVLICDLLDGSEIKIHFTESRTKSIESLTSKLDKPGKSYSNVFSEIPDLVGVRIVLYYQDNSKTVQELIKREFTVLEIENTHQPDKYSPDQFGYISTHLVVQLNEVRSALPEWKMYKDFQVEIQIRTVLQHSWAAISHALQYKREGDVPLALRRKLYRLAGLFELADEQFIQLRDESTILRGGTPAVVEKNDDVTPVDSLVFAEFIKSSQDLNVLIEYMREVGFEIVEDAPGDYPDEEEEYIGVCVEELERLSVANLGFLNGLLEKDHTDFMKSIFQNGWVVSKAFTIYLLIIREFPSKFSVNYLHEKTRWGKLTAEHVKSKVRENA